MPDFTPDVVLSNRNPADATAKPLTVQIGWRYTDGIPDADNDGQPVPRIVSIPRKLTHEQVVQVAIARIATIDQAEGDDAAAAAAGLEMMNQLAALVVGQETLDEIDADQTVASEEGTAFRTLVARTVGMIPDEDDTPTTA